MKRMQKYKFFVYGPLAWALGTLGPTFVYGPLAWALGTLGPKQKEGKGTNNKQNMTFQRNQYDIS